MTKEEEKTHVIACHEQNRQINKQLKSRVIITSNRDEIQPCNSSLGQRRTYPPAMICMTDLTLREVQLYSLEEMEALFQDTIVKTCQKLSDLG